MIDIQTVRVNTAGAYITIDGYYLFAIGIQPYNGCIPVVRLGGHRQDQETGWQCAVREVYEEASLQLKPLLPPTTYLGDWDHIEEELQEIEWCHETEGEPSPILVVTYCRENNMHLSLMYLAEAEGLPTPSTEVKGLLLLKEEDIHRLCQESWTFGEYLQRGGKAILNAEFDERLVLEALAQLRLLSRILNRQSRAKA